MMTEERKRSDEAWAKALPIVQKEAREGRPYIPWAGRPYDLPQADIPSFLYSFLWLRQIFVGIAHMQRSESTLLQQKLLKVPVSSSFLFGFVKLLIQKYNNKTKEEKICNQ